MISALTKKNYSGAYLASSWPYGKRDFDPNNGINKSASWQSFFRFMMQNELEANNLLNLINQIILFQTIWLIK